MTTRWRCRGRNGRRRARRCALRGTRARGSSPPTRRRPGSAPARGRRARAASAVGGHGSDARLSSARSFRGMMRMARRSFPCRDRRCRQREGARRSGLAPRRGISRHARARYSYIPVSVVQVTPSVARTATVYYALSTSTTIRNIYIIYHALLYYQILIIISGTSSASGV